MWRRDEIPKELLDKYYRGDYFDWEMDSNEKLLKIILNKKASLDDQLTAITLAGDLGVIDLEVVSVFNKLIQDKEKDYSIRLSAMMALEPILQEVQLSDYLDEVDILESQGENDLIKLSDLEETLKILHDVYFDYGEDELIRRTALYISSHVPNDWCNKEVEIAYRSNNASWKETAVKCFEFIPGYNEEVLEILEGKDKNLKIAALPAIGSQRILEALPTVVKIIEKERGNVELFTDACSLVLGMDVPHATDLIKDQYGYSDEFDHAISSVLMKL